MRGNTRTGPPLWWGFALIAALTLVLDVASKQWALGALTQGQYQPVLGRVLGFDLHFNPGAAFSFLTGATWIFTLLAAAVSVFILLQVHKLRSWWWVITLASLLGGTLGNLADRIFREPGVGTGHVVDFINYGGLFIGNVADIFIVIAAIGIAILAFLGVPLDGRRTGEADG